MTLPTLKFMASRSAASAGRFSFSTARVMRGTEGKVGFDSYGSTANQYGRKSSNMVMTVGLTSAVALGLGYYLYQAQTADHPDGSAKPAVRGGKP
ncbi:hypothetical protein PYCC9005_000238 [Savitreella phatthalungensis]